MPASEVMKLYRQHKLHSGPGGPIVKNPAQATAIQISMARREGHHIPKPKGSFQQGGLVPATGDYQVHQGEVVKPKPREGVVLGGFDQKDTSSSPKGPITHRDTVPPSSVSDKFYGQGDIQHADYTFDPATEVWHPILKHRERAPGVQSFKHGGRIPRTGIYRLHKGEQVIPKGLARRYREAKHG